MPSNEAFQGSTTQSPIHGQSLPESISLPASLSEVRLSTLPESVYYISSFITPEEEDYLINKITTQPQTTWRNLSHRRLQAYPHVLSPAGELRKAPLPVWLEHPLISRLLALNLNADSGTSNSNSTSGGETLFANTPHTRPNHVLVNEYAPGSGIAPHEDGPVYHPLVATVSLAGHTVLDIYEKKPDDDAGRGVQAAAPKWRILQEPRSLLITLGEAYVSTLHGIQAVHVDEGLCETAVANWTLLREETRRACVDAGGCLPRQLRVSATIRDVLTVRDYARLLPGLLGRRS